MNLQALFSEAAGLHQQGKLAEAERLYLKLLEVDPMSGPGRHLLGVLRSQQGRNDEAVQLIGGALKANPSDFGALLNYGLVLQRQGRFDEALAAYDRALAVKPDFVEAHFNRGVLMFERKRFEEALASYDKALALRPNYGAAHYNRGVLLSDWKRFADAVASYDKALALNPRLVEALDNRGNALRALGRYDDALASYDKALALDPGLAVVHYNRGVTLMDMKRHDAALVSLDAALAAKPDLAAAHYSRGAVLAATQRFEDSLLSYDKALALIPAYADALNNRGVALWNLGRHGEARACYERAVAANPAFAEAWNNLAGLLYAERDYGGALASYDKALAADPNNATAWNGRGSALREMRRAEEALASFDKALTLKPDYVEALANRAIVTWEDLRRFDAAAADLERLLALAPDWPYGGGELLHLKMQGCDWRDFDAGLARIDEAVRTGKRAVRPFVYQAVSSSPADLLACARIFAADTHPAAPPLGAKAARSHDKIRIGYVSGEFRDQATSHLMAGVYERHDRSRFDIVAFDTGWHDDSAMRQRLQNAFGGFVDLVQLSDLEAARKVLAEEIDILVNLNGYFGDQRTGIFAHRPAPVQVNYLGFPGTLGADYIDYIVADAVVIPENDKRFYSEKVVWLPDSYQANDRERSTAPGGPGRETVGLPEDAFVFCNFNQSYKLTPSMFAAWTRILNQVEGSVLWLWVDQAEAAANLKREAAAAGVAPERLVFAQGLPGPLHRARLKLADLFLDSIPYNAHTTASDALWAGLPLLTCRGSTFPGRVAASLLTAAGLPELVTETMADYERRAIELARDTASLKALRDRLEQNRLTSALFDTERFTRHLEQAYETMHEIASRGEAPRSFSV